MNKPAATPTTKQAPIERGDLDHLIRYHQDSLLSHRWQMSPSTVFLLENTIKTLKHYRDLTDLIDAREPDPDPFTPDPVLPPYETPTPNGAPR